MNRLEVTEKEATQFFKLFEKIDGDHSGSIEIEEFFMYFKIEPTEFAQRAFGIMDFEGGKVSSEKDLLEEKKKKVNRNKTPYLWDAVSLLFLTSRFAPRFPLGKTK